MVELPSGNMYSLPSQITSAMLTMIGSISVKLSVTIESHPVGVEKVYGPKVPPTKVMLPSGNTYSSPAQKLSVKLVSIGVSIIEMVTVNDVVFPQSSDAVQVQV